jgi:Holliday junction resolvasome RuvABC ATP-dependent DNA helicase subunit
VEERYLKALEQASSVAERDSIRRQIAAEELAALRKELDKHTVDKIQRQMMKIIESERRRDILSLKDAGL